MEDLTKGSLQVWGHLRYQTSNIRGHLLWHENVPTTEQIVSDGDEGVGRETQFGLLLCKLEQSVP